MNRHYMLALSCVMGHAAHCMEVVKQSDWKAEQYKCNSELQYKAAMGALSRIQFKGDEFVLDIGCGDGRVTAEIAKKTLLLVLGIDISPNMIEHARNNHKEINLSFDLQDISKSKTSEELAQQFKATHCYDLITAFSSLSWVKDQRQAFINIARLLTRRGELRARLAHEDSAYLRARFAMHNHNTWKEYFVGYEVPYYPSNEEKIKELLQEACLRPIEVAKREIPQRFATRQEFINWMRVIPAQIDRIPEERHEEFFNAIVDEYLKGVPENGDGSIDVTIGALVVHAGFV